jgi:hypothetical protein
MELLLEEAEDILRSVVPPQPREQQTTVDAGSISSFYIYPQGHALA